MTSVFLRHVAEAHEMASNSGVATLRNFHRPQARENACWGAPQTRGTSGQIVPKSRRKRGSVNSFAQIGLQALV